MKKVLIYSFNIYGIIALFYLFQIFNRTINKYQDIYPNQNLILAYFSLFIFTVFAILVFKRRMNPVPIILIIVAIIRLISVIEISLDMGHELSHLFFGMIGFIRFTIYFLIIFANLYFSKIDVSHKHIILAILLIFTFITSFLYAFNYGVFANELVLEQSSIDFANGVHILLFAFLNFYQIVRIYTSSNIYTLK